jgi:hypothetical protein
VPAFPEEQNSADLKTWLLTLPFPYEIHKWNARRDIYLLIA